jgi:hypothetical protein
LLQDGQRQFSQTYGFIAQNTSQIPLCRFFEEDENLTKQQWQQREQRRLRPPAAAASLKKPS